MMTNLSDHTTPGVPRLLELYAMAAENRAALHNEEALEILKAHLALQVFERAMQRFCGGRES